MDKKTKALIWNYIPLLWVPAILIAMIVCGFWLFEVTREKTIPYGVWKSQDPCIVIDANPQSEDAPRGHYCIDGVETEIVANFRLHFGELEIYSGDTDLNTDNDYNKAYFGGTYKVKKNKLYLKMQPYSEEKTGIKQIVFEKVADYESP